MEDQHDGQNESVCPLGNQKSQQVNYPESWQTWEAFSHYS